MTIVTSLIVATGLDGEIGLDNQLLWKIKDDLRQFKQLTWGKHLLMGSKTFASLKNPLPGRTTIVLSRSQPSGRFAPDVWIVNTIEDAYSLVQELRGNELVVCGGGAIYRELLPRAQQIHWTLIWDRKKADIFFPIEDLLTSQNSWRSEHYQFHQAVNESPSWEYRRLVKVITT